MRILTPVLRVFAGGSLLGWAASGTALAVCPYTTDAMLADLMVAEDSLRSDDAAGSHEAAVRLESGLNCLAEVMPAMITGRVYRAVGSGLFVGGDQMRGMDWFTTAAEIEQIFEFGLEDLPVDHPIRPVYAGAKGGSSGPTVPVSGMSFVAEGVHYLDGRRVSVPKARLKRPHLYQWELDDNVQSWVIEGNRFPPDILTSEVVATRAASAEQPKRSRREKSVRGDPNDRRQPAAEPAPKREREPKQEVAKTERPAREARPPKERRETPTLQSSSGSSGSVVVERQRPWEKTPLIVGGGVIVGGAGAVYYLSSLARGRFDDAATLEDTERYRAQTNQLVLASAAVLAAGTGVLSWGIILDGGPPVPGIHLRF